METILDNWITVSLIGSGYAALHMVEIKDSKLGTYSDVQDTGIGRYRTREEAEREAKSWAEAEDMPLRLKE